ncbi:MAG: beta-ketoacyl-ACP synthase III, partial [Phycisphaerae bacterium]
GCRIGVRMKVDWPVEIAGTGMYVPERVFTNTDFEKQGMETSDEWIVKRTGIRERRFCRDDESTLDLAEAASRAALENAGLTPNDIDLIICGTITPEHTLPATACELQARLGCREIPAFDQVSACTGFTWSFLSASQFIVGGMAERALVIGAEAMSRITDLQDRGTAILFGDAAGAAILQRSTAAERKVLAARMGSDGTQSQSIWIPAGGSKEPTTPRTVNEKLHFVRMNGREVYKFAVTKMQEVMQGTLDDAGVSEADVAYVIPHQSNLRIIESACEKLGFGLDRVMINIDRYGNTSAASVAVGLHEARRDGKIKSGDLVLMMAFGAGLTWGSALVRM